MKFNVGDEVVCVQTYVTGGLLEGSIHIVKATDYDDPEGPFISITTSLPEDCCWLASRFVLVSEHFNKDVVEEQPTQDKSATGFLESAASIQKARAVEYDKESGERSAEKIAQAFNAITGKSLTTEDVWMLLVILKQVRFYNNPSAKHYDSCLDMVSYAALFAESVFEEKK